jgi:hypothetical protein
VHQYLRFAADLSWQAEQQQQQQQQQQLKLHGCTTVTLYTPPRLVGSLTFVHLCYVVLPAREAQQQQQALPLEWLKPHCCTYCYSGPPPTPMLSLTPCASCV